MKNKFFGVFLIAAIAFLGVKAVSAQFALSAGGCGYGYGYDASTGYGYGTVACASGGSSSSGGSTSIKPWTSTVCSAFTQNLKKGDRDGRKGISEVSSLQKFLNQQLGLNLKVDGVFGSKTATAVKNFQKTNASKAGIKVATGNWANLSRAFATSVCK